MRRLISAVLYLTMILIGLGLSVGFLVHGGRNIVFAAGAFLAAFGAYLFWADFLSSKTGA